MLRKKENLHSLKRKKRSFNKPLSFISLTRVFICILVLISLSVSASLSQEELVLDDNFEKIEEIEKNLFKSKFPKESKSERVSRVEKYIFGSDYPEKDFAERIQLILKALNIKPKKQPKLVHPRETEETTKEVEVSESTKNEIANPSKDEISKKMEEINERIPKAGSSVDGVFGNLSKIEEKVFGMSFDNVAFPKRVEALEFKVLSRSERGRMKSKSLLERVNLLVNKTHIHIDPMEGHFPTENKAQKDPNKPRFIIDKVTGNLVNEETGAILHDNYGNPLNVNRQPPAQNTLPFGNAFGNTNQQDDNPLNYILQQKYGLPPGTNFPNQANPGGAMQLPPELLLQLNQLGVPAQPPR